MSDQSLRPGRVTGSLTYLVMVFMLLPLIAIIPVSFTAKRYLSMPDGALSLRHYETLMTNGRWQDGLLTSLSIGIMTAVLSTTLAALFGIGLWYRRPRLTVPLVGIALLPMAVPPVISAVVLYFFESATGLFDTTFGVVLAHTVLAVPYAVITILVALTQIDRRIELAARNLGANLWQTTFLVILPNLKFGLRLCGNSRA